LYTSPIKIEITAMIPNLFFVPRVVGGAVDDVDDVFEDLLVKMSKLPLLSSCGPTTASPAAAAAPSSSSYSMDMASSEKLSLVTKLLMRYVLYCFTTSYLTSIVEV
jgi:hypothetical protein